MFKGKMISGNIGSEIYPGTTRDYWVYVPVAAIVDIESNLMVFQDGESYKNPERQMNIPAMIDKLIENGSIAPTICVFINPGIVTEPTLPEHAPITQRSIEYDTMNDQYTRFLINELLPIALQGLNVSHNPDRRVMAGLSSGGICAWSVAWYRSDLFGKVLSHCGSFTDIRGGGAYPSMIRTQAAKPIKMFFQSGAQDLDTKFGDWGLGNKAMASALDFMGYENKFYFGEEGHNFIHGAELLEESIIYLLGN